MKIAFVIKCLKDGGAEREVVAFADTLVKLGAEVHIVCEKEGEEEYFPDPRVIRHKLAYSSTARNPKLRKLCNALLPFLKLRKLRVDMLILVCNPMGDAAKFLLATLCSKTRLIYAVRNNLEKKYPAGKGRRRWKKNCFLADGIWIQTEGQRGFFPRYMQKKIFEVPNLLNRRFLEIPREERPHIHRFISVGRIHPQKNQKLLITAFARMLSCTRDQDATLTIYGRAQQQDEGLEQELKTMILKYRLEKRIFLPGRVSDIEQKYEEADVFVFGSDYEGCPNALMEAMAAGLPCVSTDCPTGPSDLITAGTNGLLVPVGDTQAMAQAMQYLLEHPREAGRMGMEARQRMKAWGSPEEIAGRLLSECRKS